MSDTEPVRGADPQDAPPSGPMMEPQPPRTLAWRLRSFPVSRVVLVLLLALASLSIVNGLREGTSSGPLRQDIENASRILESPVGVDERKALNPVGAAGGEGIVEPVGREIRVAAAVSGRVAAVLVQEGDRVSERAPLVLLESGPEEAALAAAEAELAAARASLAKATRGTRREDVEAAIAEAEAAQAQAALSADVLARTERLAAGGAATPDALEKARRQAQVDRQNAQSAEARRRAAVAGSRYEDVLVERARVASAEASRNQAKAMLDRLTIRAPVAGEILQIKYRVGEYQTPGAGQDPVVVMGDTSELRVRLDIDERDIGKVMLNASAFVTASAYPGRKLPGRVVEIGRRMGRKNLRSDDPTDRVDTKILEVLIALDKHEGLVPGLRVSGYVIPQNAPP